MIEGVVRRRRGCLGACEPVLQFDEGASPGSRACRFERVSYSRLFSRSLAIDGPVDIRLGGRVMEVLDERQSALDVHKAQVTVCVRVPDEGGGRREPADGKLCAAQTDP